MTAIRDLPGIAHLTGVLRNPSQPIPVFLAAAGPSLDSIAPLFPEISKRCVVVAVDTSLKLIRDAGVDPDFAVVVDPQYWNSRHLDRAFAPRTCLIAESAVYPPVLRHPFQRAFLCASLFPLGEFVENRLDPKGRLGAGGSVAATAWDFARRLGPSALWIGGLDLAFPDLKTHFKGALFENRALAESTRFNPLETWSVRALGDGKPFQAPSASGGFVLTDRRLSLYAAWFESRIQRVPELPNYRLSDEGIAIAGLSRVSEKELLALPVQRNHINQRLQEAFIRIEETFNKQRIPRDARYQEALGELLEGLKQINALAEEGFRIADRAYQQRKQCRNPEEPGHYDQDGIFKTLERIDKEIRESAVKDVAGFLFPPFEALEQERAETEPLLRYLEVSANLYRSLKETAKYNLDVLEKCTKG
jgi:hypothetical protein